MAIKNLGRVVGTDGKSAYEIWLDAGNTGSEQDFLNSLKGKDGINGTNGIDGENGLDGRGIVSIEKTKTDGLVDTYTINYTDETTSTFDVTNGKDETGTVDKVINEALTVTSANTTYTITDTLFTLDDNPEGIIPYAYFDNEEIILVNTPSNGYFIFAKCTNGYVIMNGRQNTFYIPNGVTASSQATAITILNKNTSITSPIKFTKVDDGLKILSADILMDLTSETINANLRAKGVNDSFESFVLGFSRDVTSSNGVYGTMEYNIEKTVTVSTKSILDGKKISIIGDSISTYNGYNPSGYATHYPRSNIDSVEKTWWYSLCEETGAELLVNASWSGSYVTGDSTSTSNAIASCSDKRISDIAKDGKTPDIVLCYIGINDFGQNVHRELGEYTGITKIPENGTIETLSEAYGLMLYKILSTYPNARVYACSLLETNYTNWDTGENGVFPTINNNGVSVSTFNERIETIAKNLGAGFIDLHSCGITYWNLSTYTHDGLHPNMAGAKLIKNQIKVKLLNDFSS